VEGRKEDCEEDDGTFLLRGVENCLFTVKFQLWNILQNVRVDAFL
jgi:hypothetical protein